MENWQSTRNIILTLKHRKQMGKYQAHDSSYPTVGTMLYRIVQYSRWVHKIYHDFYVSRTPSFFIKKCEYRYGPQTKSNSSLTPLITRKMPKRKSAGAISNRSKKSLRQCLGCGKTYISNDKWKLHLVDKPSCKSSHFPCVHCDSGFCGFSQQNLDKHYTTNTICGRKNNY